MKLLRTTSIAGLTQTLADNLSNIAIIEGKLLVLNGDEDTLGSVDNVVKQANAYTDANIVGVDLAQVLLNQNEIAKLNGDDTVDGSVAKDILDNITSDSWDTNKATLEPQVDANTTGIDAINCGSDGDLTSCGPNSVHKQISDLRDGVAEIYDTVVEIATETLLNDVELTNMTDSVTNNRTALEDLHDDHDIIADAYKVTQAQKFVDELAINKATYDTEEAKAVTEHDGRYFQISNLLSEVSAVPTRITADTILMSNTTVANTSVTSLDVDSKVYMDVVSNVLVAGNTPTDIYVSNAHTPHDYLITIPQIVYDDVLAAYNADVIGFKLQIKLDNDIHGLVGNKITYATVGGDKIVVTFSSGSVVADTYEFASNTFDIINGFSCSTESSVLTGTENIIEVVSELATGPFEHRIVVTVPTDFNFIVGNTYEFTISSETVTGDSTVFTTEGPTEVNATNNILFNGQAIARENLGIVGATEAVDMIIASQDKYIREDATVVGEVIALDSKVSIAHVKWIHINYPGDEYDTIYLENGPNAGEFKSHRIVPGDMDGEVVEVSYVLSS